MDKPRIRVVSAEIERGGRFLITQRRRDAVLPLLWEFPGGRVHAHESDADALRRCLSHRLDVTVDVGDSVLQVVHDYPDYTLTLVVYRCTTADDPFPRYVEDLAWVAPEHLSRFDFPGADQATVDQLVQAEE